MYCRYSWHTKNTWCFLYLFLWSMICWNQIEESLYPHLWVCEQFYCKILVQNGGYSLFQALSLTLQNDPPGQHKHWPFLPELDQKMWWKEFLLHIDQALIGSSKFGHVGVFVNYVLQVSNVTNGNFGFHLAQGINNFQWNPQEQSLHSLSGILFWLSEN